MSKVLIVDDDTQCLKLFEECLSVEGYELSFAETGAEALKLASQAQIRWGALLHDCGKMRHDREHPETVAFLPSGPSVTLDFRES
jgi:CheY-like chemotaxis protein